MRRGVGLLLAALLALVLAAAACATAPVTGRPQLILVSEGEADRMGAQAYQDVVSKSQVVTGTPEAQLVRQVGQRLARVSPQVPYQWQFSLVRDNQANAFALPGGHVVVYTGILRYAQTPDELATVMAHEMAHNIARHGAERMSQQLVTQLGAAGLQAAVGAQSPAAMDALMTAYGAGTQVGILLPFSRTQESEADHIGLVLMAKAGYDPRQAVGFWQKMMAAGGAGRQPPTFLSTHPADQQRIADLEREMPEALADYRQATGQQPPQPQAAPQAAPSTGRGQGFIFGPYREGPQGTRP